MPQVPPGRSNSRLLAVRHRPPSRRSHPNLLRSGTEAGRLQLHLLDATYELFRAHFGRPPHADADGQPVGATLGVVESVLSLFRDDAVTPVGCATDHVIESWRNTRYAGYKSSIGVPRELLAQFQ